MWYNVKQRRILMPRPLAVILFLSIFSFSSPAKARLLKKGEDCTLNSNCTRGLKCISQQISDYGIGSCRELGNTCVYNEDCCSQKCTKKRCVRFSLCGRCTSKGKKPKADSPCCPGLYKGLSKVCISDIPPSFGMMR